MAKVKTPKIPKVIIRIAPEEIQESFLQTKFIPIQNYIYFRKTRKGIGCCGLGAYFVKSALEAKRTIEDIMSNIKIIPIGAELENYGGYDPDYLAGFVRGWDGGDLPMAVDSFKMGHEDGKNSWKLVIKNV